MKRTLSAFLFVISSLSAQQHTVQFFSKDHFALTQEEQQKLEQLITWLGQTPFRLQQQAAALTLEHLEYNLKSLKHRIEEQNQQKKSVNRRLFYEQFILNEEIKHLRTFITQEQSVVQKLMKFVNSALFSITSLFQDAPTVEKLAPLLDNYFEKLQQILLNKDQLIELYSAKKRALPPLLNLFDNETLQFKLYNRAQRIYANPASVQQVGILITMGLQALIMAGGSMYKQWVNEQLAAKFKELQSRVKTIQENYQSFLHTQEENFKAIVKKLSTSFINSESAVKMEYDAVNKQQAKEITYLFRSIDLDAPRRLYLEAPLLFDQMFAQSPMLTPDNDNTWYNVYQTIASDIATKANWEYDHESDSFFQMSAFTFGEPQWATTPLNFDPSQNSIFTEYISSQPKYDIEIEVTPIAFQDKFFVGIMFNRARWISGDPERTWQYRLVGLYGKQSDQKDPKTRTITVNFAQLILQMNKDTKKTEKIISPLEQIDTGKGQKLYTFSSKDIQSIITDSPTFIFAIKNASQQVTITVSQKIGGKTTQLVSKTLTGLDAFLSMFHGIGFMSPGCVAQFKITKPAVLTYNTAQRKAFATNIETLLTTYEKKSSRE